MALQNKTTSCSCIVFPQATALRLHRALSLLQECKAKLFGFERKDLAVPAQTDHLYFNALMKLMCPAVDS